MLSKDSSTRLRGGLIVKVPLGTQSVAYGLTLKEPLIAFFEKEFPESSRPKPNEILDLPVLFILMVMNYAVTSGRWPIIYKVKIPQSLAKVPAFFKKDSRIGNLSIYQEVPELAPLYERPASHAECIGLERAAVWDPEHVEDRLRDRFAGRPNRWVEALKLEP